MYYQNYEEYMRDSLGYPNPYYNTIMPTYYGNYQSMANRNMEELYPELYRSIYPLVCKVCDRNTKPLNADTLEEMVAEVFVNLEVDGENTTGANVKIQVRNNSNGNITTNSRQKEENTRQRNPILQDLIRILILRELLGRPGIRPNPPRPPRPPYPGPRPPMPRIDYQDNMYY